MESTMTLTGYVGHNLELRQTKTGFSTVSFRVGTTPRIRTEDGWTDGATTWMTVVCYRALADHVARSVVKGDPVIVHGRVRTQSWTDARGQQHEKMVVEAGSVGHDLSRGVAAFARASMRSLEGPPVPEPADPADEDEPMDEPEDAFAGTGQAAVPEELALAA